MTVELHTEAEAGIMGVVTQLGRGAVIMTAAQNAKVLDKLIEELDAQYTSPLDYRDAKRILKKKDRDVLLFDLVELEDLAYPRGNALPLIVLTQAYTVVEEAVNRKDNLLNLPENPASWQDGYKRAVAKFLAAKARPAELPGNFYGWVDYALELSGATVVGVYRIFEDEWKEFGDSLNTNEFHGVAGLALYSNGAQRIIRWEGTLTEIMYTMFND